MQCYFYIGIKRLFTNNTEVNYSIQSTTNEKKLKIRNISIKLVDIAKSYKETTKAVVIEDEQNQLYVDRSSAKGTSTGNNKKVRNYYKIIFIIQYCTIKFIFVIVII